MDKVFNRIFISFGVLFVMLQMFNAGQYMHDKKVTETVLNVVISLFWVFLVWLLVRLEIDRRVQEVHRKHEKATMDMLDGLNRFMDAQIKEKHNHDMVEAIIKNVVGKGKSSPKHCAKIAAAIFENLDLYAEVSYNKQGGFDVGLSKQPFKAPAPTKKAPAKKPTVKKPVTKKKGTK